MIIKRLLFIFLVLIGSFELIFATNGVCGGSNGANFYTSPGSSLCSDGTASVVSGSGPWNWDCLPVFGGTTDSCSANKKSDGFCGSSLNSCTSGGFQDVADDTTYDKWKCKGSNGGLDSSICLHLKLVLPESTCPSPAGTMDDGDSLTFFSSNLVPFGSSCTSVSQLRTCSTGVLSGSSIYNKASCIVDSMSDGDADGFDDVGSSGNGHDDCPGTFGLFEGCKYEYTGTCSNTNGSWMSYNGGGLTFNNGKIECDYSDGVSDNDENFITFDSVSPFPIAISSYEDDLNFLPTAGTGTYSCKNLNTAAINGGVPTDVGTCTLTSRIGTPNPLFIDTDFDGVEDSSDLCIGGFGGKHIYSGCSSEYTINGSCTNPSVTFDGTQLRCDYYDCFFCNNNNYFDFGGVRVSSRSDEVFYTPNMGSGVYKCYNVDTFGSDDFVGSCNLIHNSVNSCSNQYLTLNSGEFAYLYKYENILPSEVGDLSIRNKVTCVGTSFTSFDFNTYSVLNPRFLKNKYKNFERLSDGSFRKIDNENYGKVKCNKRQGKCEVKVNGYHVPVDLNLTATQYNSIKIYKNNVFDRNEEIDALSIGLYSHILKDFQTPEEITNFVNHSYNLMSKFKIVKNLTYGSGKTNVKIQLKDIPFAEQRDLTIYQIIPKDVANNLRNLDIISYGGGEFFVLDKDPVIGWYFNDSDSNATIEYETNGSNEGGVIIVSQEAILFNEGELVIKYREVNCNADEINLFELDSLVDSDVYSAGSGKLFKVCLSHISDDITLVPSSSLNDFEMFSYVDSGNASDNLTMFSNVVVAGVDNSSIYWSSKISEDNPHGAYSCVGSFSNIGGTSKFGDCGNNGSNRLWIHLGEDITHPTSTLTSQAISHNVPVTITAVDDIAGSGVRGIYYCSDLTDTCNPLLGTYVPGDKVDFTLSCPNKWGCVKNVRVVAVDNANNYEPVNSNFVKIIDIKSSCQADCTVKPSPNRYIAECNNLNYCDYYNTNNLGVFDDGVYVSNLCDYGIEGSYAKYNSTHEILCPSGPFRESIFGNELVDLSGSACNDIHSYNYPLIVDKETVLMKVYTCID
jgi:hypothetical protein